MKVLDWEAIINRNSNKRDPEIINYSLSLRIDLQCSACGKDNQEIKTPGRILIFPYTTVKEEAILNGHLSDKVYLPLSLAWELDELNRAHECKHCKNRAQIEPVEFERLKTEVFTQVTKSSIQIEFDRQKAAISS